MQSFTVKATNLNTGTERLVAQCVKAQDAARLAYDHNTKNGFDPLDTYIVSRSSK